MSSFSRAASAELLQRSCFSGIVSAKLLQQAVPAFSGVLKILVPQRKKRIQPQRQKFNMPNNKTGGSIDAKRVTAGRISTNIPYIPV